MNSDLIMIRFGELSTKGKNLKSFIQRLGYNIRMTLDEFKSLSYQISRDHIYIYLNDENFDLVKEKLEKIPGILSFSLCKAVKDRDIEKVAQIALESAKDANKSTFKIHARRVDKLYPMRSDEINRYLATVILKNLPNYKVDVHNPELLISLIVREDVIYIYSDNYSGVGGYPNGIAGKALMMISGGIDSPVASYLLMKRGIKLEMVHFASPPYTSDMVLIKIRDLLKKLTPYQLDIKLYVVPFTKIQEKIYEVAGTSYAITIMRRMMLRIAERIALSHKDLVICNGESVGQVASQTLKSIRAIEKDMKLPILRPLCTYDKLDIIKIAKKIDTYEISIRPYEDCCTIFEVKDPTTAPNFEKVEKIEEKFDFQPLLDEAYKDIRVEWIHSKEEDEF